MKSLASRASYRESLPMDKSDQTKDISVAQILYSGLGGHGSVVFSMLDAAAGRHWRHILGFLGIEPLLDVYREYCDKRLISSEYFRVTEGKPFLVWPKITVWLYRTRPDVLLLHSVKALLPCLLYTAVFSRPLIFVEHQPNVLKTSAEWRISRLGMLLATRVVYLTENYADEVRERLSTTYRKDKVELIANGIDTQSFRPEGREIFSDNSVTIGMAARFTDKRRQDVLVETIEKLISDSPKLDWHLTLAGDGTTLESVRKQVVARGLNERVTLTGHLNEPELIKWFQGLDIYAHASEGETLSTSMLQAMACGLPVVGSDVPGIKNLLSEKVPIGLLAQEQQSGQFATLIQRLVSDVSTSREMGLAARRTVEEKYSHTKMFEMYDDLIKRSRA